MRRRLVPVAAVAFVLAGALAGCSGGDDDATSSTTGPTPTTQPAERFSGDGGSEFCVRARAWKAMPPIDSTRKAEAAPDYQAQAAAVRGLVDVAPPEIVESASVQAAFVDNLLTQLAAADWDLERLPPAGQLLTDEAAAAQRRVDSYIEQVCQAP